MGYIVPLAGRLAVILHPFLSRGGLSTLQRSHPLFRGFEEGINVEKWDMQAPARHTVWEKFAKRERGRRFLYRGSFDRRRAPVRWLLDTSNPLVA